MDYALLQQGKHDAARRHFDLMRTNLAASPTAGRQGYLLAMRAHYLIMSERWTDSIASRALVAPLAGPVSKAMDAFALAYAAARRGERPRAEAGLATLREIARKLEADRSYVGNQRIPAVLAAELEAVLLWDGGRREEAITMLRGVTREEDGFPAEFGPPDVVKPTHELLGELLLASGRPAEAQRDFLRALELAPGRSLSLLGLVRAARASGDAGAAERALLVLDRNWSGADPDLPGLAELKRPRAAR
jgi:tetratricopeptide (TPR) repeat protein